MKMTAAIFLGLVSVIATELIGIEILKRVDASIDLTANMLTVVVPAAVAIVTIIMSALLFVVFRANPKRYIPAFLITWIVFHAFALVMLMGNPVPFSLSVVAIVVVVGGGLLAVAYQLFWRRSNPS